MAINLLNLGFVDVKGRDILQMSIFWSIIFSNERKRTKIFDFFFHSEKQKKIGAWVVRRIFWAKNAPIAN